MATEDEFIAMLGSMDEQQLHELELELSNRANQGFGLGDPRSKVRGPGEGGSAGKNFASHYDDMDDLYQHIASFGGKTLYSAYDAYKGIGQSKSNRKKKKKYEEAMRKESARQKQIIGERLKQVQGQRKTVGMRNQVDQQFRDLNLEGLFDRVVKGNLDSSLIGITQQHDDLSRQSGFDAVRSGLGGSSVDAERVADVQSSQEQAMAQAASQAQMQRTQLGQQADTARRNLLSSVSGSNPGEEARLSGEISNLHNSANAANMNAGLGMFGMQQNQQQMAGQSQALGGLLSNYANLYNTQNSR